MLFLFSFSKTFCSAKNRRKHERKLLSLKPGNPFEDIALIDALHNEVMKLVNQQEQVRDTCKALMKLQMNELASSLQKQYAQILTLLQDSFDTIWTEEMANAHTMQYKQSPYTDYTQLQNEQRYALLGKCASDANKVVFYFKINKFLSTHSSAQTF